jgi:hypothetical protein
MRGEGASISGDVAAPTKRPLFLNSQELEDRTMRKAVDGEWLSLRQSRIVSGRDAHMIMKMAMIGEVEFRVPPGSTPEFRRTDVEKLARHRQFEPIASRP